MPTARPHSPTVVRMNAVMVRAATRQRRVCENFMKGDSRGYQTSPQVETVPQKRNVRVAILGFQLLLHFSHSLRGRQAGLAASDCLGDGATAAPVDSHRCAAMIHTAGLPQCDRRSEHLAVRLLILNRYRITCEYLEDAVAQYRRCKVKRCTTGQTVLHDRFTGRPPNGLVVY